MRRRRPAGRMPSPVASRPQRCGPFSTSTSIACLTSPSCASRAARHPGIRVHRTSHLSARDRTRTQLVPVTAPARTLLDLAAILDDRPLRSLVRRAQGLKRVNVRQLNEVLTRLGPRRGSRRLARVIATGPAPTRSVLEDIVLDLLLEGGFEHPDVNKPLVDRRPHDHSRLSLAARASDRRSRRRRLARRQGRTRGRRRAPGASRSSRRASRSRHLGPGRHPARPNAGANPSRRRSDVGERDLLGARRRR